VKVPFKHKTIRVFLALALGATAVSVSAQTVVDRTLATIRDPSGAVELVTLSDVLWQIALQPETQLSKTGESDIENALELVINQRLFRLEARRLPQRPVSESEIRAEIDDVASFFDTPEELIRRIRSVGFSSIDDEAFRALIEKRILIRRYTDFRFKSFVLVTEEDEEEFYKEIYVPDFRSRFGSDEPVPSLDSKRVAIRQVLIEEKISSEIEKFLDEARRSAEINYLSEK